MTPHDALTSKDVELLFAAAQEGDGTILVFDDWRGLNVRVHDKTLEGATLEGVFRLAACGYVEGGPDAFHVTRAGFEYAESMK